jgi:uncharacterized protein (UPF0335 family)
MIDDTAKQRLTAYIEKIERLEEEKAGIGEDIKEVYNEAGSVGFDKKIMRQVVKARKKSREELTEEQELLDLYLEAVT